MRVKPVRKHSGCHRCIELGNNAWQVSEHPPCFSPSAAALQEWGEVEVVFVHGKVFDEMLPDKGEPLHLLGGEGAGGEEFVQGLVHALFGGEEGGLGGGGVFDDGDDVGQGVEPFGAVGALKFIGVEAVLAEGALEVGHHGGPPVARVLEQDGERGDLVGVGVDEFVEGIEIILGAVEFAVALELLGGDDVLLLDGGEEGAFGAGVFEQEALEVRVAQELHGGGEVLLELLRQSLGEPGHVAFRNPGGELEASVGAHVFVNAEEAFGEDLDVVVAINVLPDVFDDLWDGERDAARRGDVEAGDVFEILDERAVEAIEDDEFGFIDVVAAAGAAAEHLFPEDAGLDRAEEDDEFEGRDVHAGGEHVHGDDDLGIGAVAELADALEGAVHVGVAGDLLDEIVALAEDLAADADELVGVGGVGEVVDGEDEDLGEAASGRPRGRRRIWRPPR